MIFLGVLLALLLICIGVGVYLFFTACGREELDLDDDEAVKTGHYWKYAQEIITARHWIEDHPHEELTVESFDGLNLCAVWVPAENAKATVILAHGYHSNFLVDFGPVLEVYHSKGFNLLLPYQRSHGKSEGRFITYGVKESRDMLSWIGLHNERFGRMPILCSGLSMGASTMMYLAGMDLPENVKAVVVDCGFTSPKEIISYVFHHRTHLPAWPFLWVTDLCARLFAKFRLDECHSVDTLAKNKLPILMVHGLADTFVPAEMTDRGFASCGGDKQLLLVEDAGHGLSFWVDEESYLKELDKIIEKVCFHELRNHQKF